MHPYSILHGHRTVAFFNDPMAFNPPKSCSLLHTDHLDPDLVVTKPVLAQFVPIVAGLGHLISFPFLPSSSKLLEMCLKCRVKRSCIFSS